MKTDEDNFMVWENGELVINLPENPIVTCGHERIINGKIVWRVYYDLEFDGRGIS